MWPMTIIDVNFFLIGLYSSEKWEEKFSVNQYICNLYIYIVSPIMYNYTSNLDTSCLSYGMHYAVYVHRHIVSWVNAVFPKLKYIKNYSRKSIT